MMKHTIYSRFYLIWVGAVGFLLACHDLPHNEHNTSTSHADTLKSAVSPLIEGVDTSKMLKEKVLLAYVQNAKKVSPNPQNPPPFDTLGYDKVIAYEFEGSEEPYPDVIKNGKFVPVIFHQQYLTQPQADKIVKLLSQKSTYGAQSSACFRPHLAFVFFKNNQKVNQISIGLACNYLISEIEIPAKNHKRVNKGTEKEYTLFGFTPQGRKAIIRFCKEIGVDYNKTNLN